MNKITLDLADDGRLLIHVPGVDRGHTFKLPFNLEGLAAIASILRERQRGKTRISEAGAPTQWDVEQWLKDHKPTRAAVRGVPKELADLELDLSILEGR